MNANTVQHSVCGPTRLPSFQSCWCNLKLDKIHCVVCTPSKTQHVCVVSVYSDTYLAWTSSLWITLELQDLLVLNILELVPTKVLSALLAYRGTLQTAVNLWKRSSLFYNLKSAKMFIITTHYNTTVYFDMHVEHSNRKITLWGFVKWSSCRHILHASPRFKHGSLRAPAIVCPWEPGHSALRSFVQRNRSSRFHCDPTWLGTGNWEIHGYANTLLWY